MNKSQLIEALASRFDGNKKDAQHALESVLDTITRAVASGEKVSITGFGAFEKLDRPSRMVRNPRTGERKRAKKTSVPKFRAGADLKAVVSGQKKLPKLKAGTTKATTAGKTTAKATPAKKSTAKTTPAKTTPAKTTAKKAPAKTTAKKTTAKTTAKTTPAKTTARKTTAKKAPAKTTAKKTAKRTTKKTTAKR